MEAAMTGEIWRLLGGDCVVLHKAVKHEHKRRACTICLPNKSAKCRTKSIAASMGVSVLCCDAGRARQMNYGAKVAKGKVFFSLFL